jgi:putative heme-binding domain-containing protein
VAGIGTDVGPDISDTRTKTPSGLLVDILNPNQAIDNNYVNYLVTLKDGKTLTGIIAAETATSISLKRAEGQGDLVLRKDIDEIQSSGVSLMPEGLEKTINVQEMADLISFLKNWRYLDGKTPLNR